MNVTGQPLKGFEPDRQGARLPGRSHPPRAPSSSSAGASTAAGRGAPTGSTVALKDCPDHFPNGAGAVAENFLSTGSPDGTHSPEGWPSFAGWPRDESQTHEGTYWKWIERAWRGGLRLMVNDLVENRALCELYPFKQNNCNEMVSAYKQADDMHALQNYIDAQFGGPGKGFFRLVRSSAEARRVINDGKLAVVLGIEVSEVLDCGQFNGTPNCDAAQIDRELDKLYAAGVRSVFPVHKFDNALGGTQFDSGGTGVLVNTGNKYATGQFWTADHCDDPDHDNSPTPIGDEEAAADVHALRARAHPAAVRGPAARLSARAALQPEGPDRPRQARDPLDDAQGHDRRDGPHEHEGAAAGPDDSRDGELPRRHLQPFLGRPRQPEAPPGARRNRRPDLERGHRFRGGVARPPGRTGTRASSSAPASAPTSTGCTRSPRRARAPRRTRSRTRFAPSTVAASSTASGREPASTTSTRTASTTTASIRTGSRTSARSPARRSSTTWRTAPRRTCGCGPAPRPGRVPS